MSIGIAPREPNLAWEVTRCGMGYDVHKESELNKLIDSLKMTNLQTKIITDVTNKLAHARKENKPADFNNDEIAMKYAYLVHLCDSTILEDKIKGVPNDGLTLQEKLQEIIGQLKEDGYSDSEIDLATIMGRIQIDNSIRLEPLSSADIDVITQGLDAAAKKFATNLNELMLTINTKYDERSQVFENLRQILKEARDFISSILHRIGR